MANECEHCGKQVNHGCHCHDVTCERCGRKYFEPTRPRPKPKECPNCFYSSKK